MRPIYPIILALAGMAGSAIAVNRVDSIEGLKFFGSIFSLSMIVLCVMAGYVIGTMKQKDEDKKSP